MKILSITAQKPDSTGSGVYLTELVRGFGEMGIEQAVIAGMRTADQAALPEGVKLYPVFFETEELPYPITGMSDEMPYPSTRYSDMTEEMTVQFRASFGKCLRRVLEEFQPDVVLCHHLYYLTAMVSEMCENRRGQGTAVKVYGVSHGSDLRQFRKNPWERAYIAEWIPRLDGIFALHEEQKELIRSIHGCEESLIRVIGTGYNSHVFYMDEEVRAARAEGCTEEGELQKRRTRLIFAGKISEKKGVKSLLRAIGYLPKDQEITLTIAGGYGQEEEYRKIREMAELCGCPVEFAGRLQQKELAKRMNESDIFVLPSFYEGLPLVVVEALACGLRVVCTDLPGIRNWLDSNVPGNGVVFVEPPEMVNEDEPVEESLPRFERALADAVCRAERAEIPERKVVERVSWDGLCTELKTIFTENL